MLDILTRFRHIHDALDSLALLPREQKRYGEVLGVFRALSERPLAIREDDLPRRR